MKFALSIFCFTLAAMAFLDGFITEYKQSRKLGRSEVPTLPKAIVAAVFVTFELWHLPNRVPFWILPFTFFGSIIIFGYAITKANK